MGRTTMQCLGHPARLLAVLVLCVCAGCAGRSAPKAMIPDDAPGAKQVADNIRAVLDVAGENAPELRRFLSRYEPGSRRRRAAWFLVANLPPADAMTMDEAALAEHVDYAFIARRAMPWGPSVPWDIFLRYVVPHRVTQEPVQPYRREFFSALAPLGVLSGDMRRAALSLNQWVFTRAAYGPSSRRDQGVQDTLARGAGRCEELSALLVAACRSLSIPARPCLVPAWRHDDGNHMWVEVWAAGGWWPLGAGEIDADFGVGWFLKPALAAPIVLAPAYGHGPSDEPLYARKRSCDIYNRTHEYTPPGDLLIRVRGGDAPFGGGTAYIFVVNGGGLTRAARVTLDEDGEGRITLGGGDYLIGAGRGGQVAYAWTSVAPDETGQVTLDLARGGVPEGGRWVRFPRYAEVEQHFSGMYESIKAQRKEATTSAETRRMSELGAFAGISAAVMQRRSVPGSEAALEVVRAAGRDGYEVLRALIMAASEPNIPLREALEQMSPKDLVAMRPEEAEAEARLARDAWQRAGHPAMDDLFRDYVLSGRVADEPHSHWRRSLAERFGSGGVSVLGAARRVARGSAALAVARDTVLGPPLTPMQNAASGLVTSEAERAVFAVAALRSLGVPARVDRDLPWVEFHDGHAWRPLYPEHASGVGDASAEARAKAWYEERGELEIRFAAGGRALDESALAYGREFAVAVIKPDGDIRRLENPKLRRDPERGSVHVALSAGRYVVTTVSRDVTGQPYLRLRLHTVRPGEATIVRRTLDHPPPEGEDAQ
ncbi:transglutaminase domain-containing protein [Desulfobaculum sp.]